MATVFLQGIFSLSLHSQHPPNPFHGIPPSPFSYTLEHMDFPVHLPLQGSRCEEASGCLELSEKGDVDIKCKETNAEYLGILISTDVLIKYHKPSFQTKFPYHLSSVHLSLTMI